MDKGICNDQIHESHSVMANQLDEPYNHLGQLPTTFLKWIDHCSNDLIVVWNQNMNIIYTSRSIRELLNYQRSDVHGHAWRQTISKEDASWIESYMHQDEMGQNTNINIKMFDNAGKKNVFQCKIEQIFDDDRNERFLIGFFKHVPRTPHVPQVKESEELMIRSEKMSIAGQLAAGIAHEIRNPLTSIKGFLQLLKAKISDQEAYIHIMSEEIDKIEAITSELLFVSKPLTDKKQVKSVKSMVQDVTLLLNTQANLRNITVVNHTKDDYFVFCDGSQIKQVLINIIKNAIEATESSGTVNVVTRKNDFSIEIDIVDEGAGISEMAIDKISEPFYTTKQEGTGLGLMISKQIIEKHYGQLQIIKNKGKGSTFRIILPEHT